MLWNLDAHQYSALRITGSEKAQRAALLLHPTYLLSQKAFPGLPHHTTPNGLHFGYWA